ncbi:MAG: hypothetical protein ACTSRI_05200 [Promethearchaeota archaeon]
MFKERLNYDELRAKIKSGEIKPISNEEIRKKRQEINKKLMEIYKLIQNGSLSDAKKEAKDFLKTEKSFKSNI